MINIQLSKQGFFFLSKTKEIKAIITLLLVTYRLNYQLYAGAQAEPTCYRVGVSGETINLDYVCEENQPRHMEHIENTLPHTHREGSRIRSIRLSGLRVMVGPEGSRFRLVVRDGKAIGVQWLRRDGSSLSSGEVLVLPSGKTLRQQRLR